MLRFMTLAIVLLAPPVALTACAASKTPVPLVGTSSDVSALAGDWTGDYSGESGRSGSISFSLKSATDSAFGDVVMVPTGLGRPLTRWRPTARLPEQAAASQVLTIRFVRIEGGNINGTIAPYADPQTGARLLTTFSGELKGNTISGTYTTQIPGGGTQTGRWSVQRR